ncbi:MAG: thiamine pyrophosphate-binding protein [Dehalococcoidia bacterium]|nr:thiamine pyrophosphate-binding protein [Dehalococcoidia bacterium]
MPETTDGGEALLEAIRELDIDYIISSPGSDWAPVWEALARQKANETKGPTYINCWHETLAVAMAMGYTQATGRMQAVLLHAGVGLLQGSLGIQTATQGEVPMLILSGEAVSYGEDPDLDPGRQWITGLSVVGGPDRWAAPITKWSSHVTSHHTLYETVLRAGEMSQRVPKGPTYVDVPLEVMLQDWTPSEGPGAPHGAPRVYPDPEGLAAASELLRRSKNPVIVSESGGRDPVSFNYIQELADLLAAPVVETGTPVFANFPKDNPLHMGWDSGPFLAESDLFLLIGAKVPWYPPSTRPTSAKVVAIDESPYKGYMVYQTLGADVSLEGDMATTLGLLLDQLKPEGGLDDGAIAQRRTRWESEHRARQDKAVLDAQKARSASPIDPVWLCAALSEVMPDNAVYVEETITHRPAILKHVRWNRAGSYYHPPTGGLGVGLGTALGVKLADPERPVVCLMGDGSFNYNPVTQALGAAREHDLPLLIVVFNNGRYASMRRNHLTFYPGGVAANNNDFYGVNIPGPRYAELCTAFGGYGDTVETPERLPAALAEGLEAVRNGQTAIIDVALGA